MNDGSAPTTGVIDEVADGLARYATRHVPYYRDAVPGPVSGLSDLPVLDKREVRGSEERFIADGVVVADLLSQTTSGTTGMPLRRFYLPAEGARAGMVLWRARRWYGVTAPRLPSCRFFSDPDGIGPVAVRDGVLSLSVRDLSDSAFASYHEALHEHRPVWLQVVPSVAARFCQWMADHGLSGPDSVRLVELNSEATLATDGRVIERAFPNARLADHYGSKETWCVSYQCQQGGRHVMTDSVLVEVLTDDGRLADFGTGDLVVTSRLFRAMPLLRYRLGDRVTVGPGPCRCGREGPLLERIEGRIAEYAVGDGGEPVYQTYFDIGVRQLMERWPGSVRRYQFVQTGSTLEAVLEPGPGWAGEAAQRLDRYLRSTFSGSEIRIVTRPIPDIPDRKFRSVLSDRVS